MREIAELAEAAARHQSESVPVPGTRAPAARTDVAVPAAEASSAPRPVRAPGTLVPGVRALEGLSELERAILYAEILGPPKAFQSEEEEPW